MVLLVGGGKKVPVPDVVGAHLANAQSALRAQGFSSDTASLPSASADAGTVISQDPPANAKIAKGSTVHLTVSSGPQRATIPSVTGDGRIAATNALNAAGFKNVKQVYKFSTDVGLNHVISVKPDEGQLVPTTLTVTLTVSQGDREDPGAQTRSARSRTTRSSTCATPACATASPNRPPTRNRAPSCRRRRPPGRTCPLNSVVTLTVAAQVTVPDVTGLTQLTARTQLSNGGFKVNVKTVDTTDKTQNFIVQSQTPEGGTKVGKGATVTITVATYAPPPKTTTTTTTPPTHDHDDDDDDVVVDRPAAAADGSGHAMRVAVLRGGRSSEHDVSLDSGASVARGLEDAGHDVVLIEVGRDGTWCVGGEEIALRAGGGLLGCDVAFAALHGPFGEDGTVQGTVRDPRRAIRRRRRAGQRRVHGQGRVQGADGPGRGAAGRLRADARGRRPGAGCPARVPVLGQAGAAGVVGRDRARRAGIRARSRP